MAGSTPPSSFASPTIFVVPARAPPLSCLCRSTPQDDRTTEENRFIDLLESTRSLRVHRIPAGEPGDTAQLTRAAWLSEWPRFDDEWFVQRPMLESARAHGARTILTGHWSDQILFVTGYLSDLFRNLAWRKVAAHLNEYASWFVDADPGYFTSRFRRELLLNLTPHSVRAGLRPWHSAIARRRVHPLASHALASRLMRRRPRMHRPKSATAHARISIRRFERRLIGFNSRLTRSWPRAARWSRSRRSWTATLSRT